MSVLRALNLAKSYKSRQVLRDLSLEVESGEVVGLLGPNGAGKTTAFYMVVGLTKCEHGEIYLDNRDITRLAMHRRAQLGLGYLPQEPSVFRRLSVSNNIMAILETRPGMDAAQRAARLKELLAELHIGHVRDSLGMSLSASGGASKLPAPWPPTRNSSCWTNPLPAWIRSRWLISSA
jgi:lipopolysaccharide export system ATP-binding protein